MTVLATVTDPDGRAVELTAERWEHIIAADNHPELADLQPEVLRAVEAPDERRVLDESEWWFFLREVGPSKWLQVVVIFSEERGFIVTAFPRRKQP